MVQRRNQHPGAQAIRNGRQVQADAPAAQASSAGLRAGGAAAGGPLGERWPVPYLATAVCVGGLLTAWLFGPVIGRLISVWDHEQDYSHGFLVAPFTVLLLWCRRATCPAPSRSPGWGGLGLLALGFAVRYAGERLFLSPLGGWALVLWIMGAFWLVAGRRVLVWALPALTFLLFMVPLPFRIEQALSWHLQTITTRVSTVMLECLCQPAIAEGHVIYLGEHELEVEQACSGLRMLMGIAAVAYVFSVLSSRPWWEKVLLALAVVPVAMLSNSIRVVITGMLMQIVSGDAAQRFSHDAAGWVMILIATALFWVLTFYLRRLVVQVAVEDGKRLAARPVRPLA